MTKNTNGWTEYEKLVLNQLEENREDHVGMANDIVQIKVEIAILKTKATVWGAGAGGIISALIYAVTNLV